MIVLLKLFKTCYEQVEFTALVQSFGTEIPRYINREVNNHQYKKKNINVDEDCAEDLMRGRDDDEDFSNGSNNVNDAAKKQLFVRSRNTGFET